MAVRAVCTGMSDQLARAREAVGRASDTADDTVREQLRSLDEGLMELTGGDKTQESDTTTEGDRLEEIEAKLAGLMDETDGDTRAHIEDARDYIDEYRRTFTRDW